VAFQPGEQKTVEIPLTAKSLAYWNEDKQAWTVESGPLKSALEVHLPTNVETTVSSSNFHVWKKIVKVRSAVGLVLLGLACSALAQTLASQTPPSEPCVGAMWSWAVADSSPESFPTRAKKV